MDKPLIRGTGGKEPQKWKPYKEKIPDAYVYDFKTKIQEKKRRRTKKKSNPTYFFIPANLNLEKLLVETPIRLNKRSEKYKDPEKLLAHLVFIIDMVTSNIARQKGRSSEKVMIHSKIFQKVIRDYVPLIDWLKEVQVIWSDDHSKEGEKSRGYKLEGKYKGSKIRTYKIYISKIAETKQIFNIHPLKQYFNSNLRMIEDKKTVNLIIQEKEQKYEKDPEKPEKMRVLKHDLDLTFHEINYCRYKFTRSKDRGRLYTSVSMMRKQLRPLLRYNDKTFLEADIKNAEPYFVLSLFDLSEDLIRKVKRYNKHVKIKVLKRIHSSLNKAECELFKQLVTTGELYDYFAPKYSKTTREQRKTAFFKMLNNKPSSTSKLKKKVVAKFPSIMNLLHYINKGFNKTLEDGRLPHEQGSALSKILYLKEAELMIDNVAPIFIQKFPGIPIFSIHDAHITYPEYVDELANIIREESERLIGVKALVSKKELTSESEELTSEAPLEKIKTEPVFEAPLEEPKEKKN